MCTFKAGQTERYNSRPYLAQEVPDGSSPVTGVYLGVIGKVLHNPKV